MKFKKLTTLIFTSIFLVACTPSCNHISTGIMVSYGTNHGYICAECGEVFNNELCTYDKDGFNEEYHFKQCKCKSIDSSTKVAHDLIEDPETGIKMCSGCDYIQEN